MMRTLKIFLIFLIFLLAGIGITVGVLYTRGFFADPQVALRELKKQEIPATAQSVEKAATAGDLPTLQTLARADVDFSQTDEEGRTALHQAISNGHLDALPILRKKGYDLDARDKAGNTPLSLLLDRSLNELAANLIQEGASPDFTLPSGELALPGYHQAKRDDDVAFLLQNGANPNSPALDGQSTLALALQDGDGELACQLLEKGADPNGLILGEPALVEILKEHQNWKLDIPITTRIIGSLLVSGADPEKAASDGQRPLQVALKSDFRPSHRTPPSTHQKRGWAASGLRSTMTTLRPSKTCSPKEHRWKKPVPMVTPPSFTPSAMAKPTLSPPFLSADANPNQFCKEGQRALFLASR